MKVARIGAFLGAVVAFAISASLWYERSMVGFPDGFVTDHDRIRKTVLAAASGASLLAGGWFVFLAWRAPQRAGTKLGVTGLAYGLLIALAFVANQYLSGRSGGGG